MKSQRQTFIKAEIEYGRLNIYTYDSLGKMAGSVMGFIYYDSIEYDRQEKRVKTYRAGEGEGAGEIVASLPVSWFTNN